MQEVKSDQAFHVIDGTSIQNLDELGSRLKRMSGEAFGHHVTSTRNDFATWVRDCMRDESLASRLMYAVDQREMCMIIGERIAKIKALNGESKRQERVAQSHKERDEKKLARVKNSQARSIQAGSVKSVPMDPPRLLPASLPSRSSQGSNSQGSQVSPSSRSVAAPISAPISDIASSIERMKSSVSSVVPSYALPRFDAAKYNPRQSKTSPNISSSSHSDDKPSPLEQRLHGLAKSVRQHKIASDLARSAAPAQAIPKLPPPSAKSPSSKSEKSVTKKAKAKPIKEAPVEDADKPIMALPFEAYKFPDSPAYLSSSQSCDHESSIGCAKCSVMEFAIGLVVGLAVALVLARSMAWF